MWQFYTERGKRAIQIARNEAINLGHMMVDPEHLLLGVLQEGNGVASQALSELGVDPENLAAHIRDLLGGSQDILAKPTDLPLSQRMTRALDVAMSEARKMGDNYVDTEHLLLGILADDGSLSVKQFKTMGLTPLAVLKQIQEIRDHDHAADEQQGRHGGTVAKGDGGEHDLAHDHPNGAYQPDKRKRETANRRQPQRFHRKRGEAVKPQRNRLLEAVVAGAYRAFPLFHIQACQ